MILLPLAAVIHWSKDMVIVCYLLDYTMYAGICARLDIFPSGRCNFFPNWHEISSNRHAFNQGPITRAKSWVTHLPVPNYWSSKPSLLAI